MPDATAGPEDVLRDAFAFLVHECGFERGSVHREDDTVALDFKHRSSGTAVRVAADARGATGFVGRLDAGGRVHPQNRDTIGVHWLAFPELGIPWPDRSAPVEEQVRRLAADARGRRARLTDARRIFGG